MKFIKAIEDSKMWKNQYEDISKGAYKVENGYYILNNQKGSGETSQYIPPVAQDIMMAKAKIKKYKKKPKRLNQHSKGKLNKRRTVKKKRSSKRKTSRKTRKNRRK